MDKFEGWEYATISEMVKDITGSLIGGKAREALVTDSDGEYQVVTVWLDDGRVYEVKAKLKTNGLLSVSDVKKV